MLLANFFLSNYDATIAMFTFIGELIFVFWLLLKGGKRPAGEYAPQAR